MKIVITTEFDIGQTVYTLVGRKIIETIVTEISVEDMTVDEADQDTQIAKMGEDEIYISYHLQHIADPLSASELFSTRDKLIASL